LVGVTTTGAAQSSEPEGAVSSVVARFREEIPELMAEQRIPGLSLVLVDGDQVLWMEGFGQLERGGGTRVSTETIFSVQSMSKVFTATGVMIGVQEGLLDLDEPIVAYLPEFTVNSAFEEHPEHKITLRMLLSHTAGFTHEAPVGNNFELAPGTFESHVASISDTWLRFPVGTGYAYSNLGIDLAGHILERVYGQPFPELMDEKVLEPIGMEVSTFDREDIRANANRAVGHVPLLAKIPVDVPMTAAGGLYSSVHDLARFLRFQLGDGRIDGRTILDPGLLAEMRRVPAPHEDAPIGYALGVDRTRWIAGHNADLFSHGGGGFGFLSDLWWLPQLQLGIAVLTNSSDHTLQDELPASILADLVHQPQSIYANRVLNFPYQDWPAAPLASYQLPRNLPGLVRAAGTQPAEEASERWRTYAGGYRVRQWEVVDPMTPSARFYVEKEVPFFETGEWLTAGRHPLTELSPGIFLSDSGEALDLAGPVPTWRNIELVRASGPAMWQWVALALAGIVALGWLAAAATRAVLRLRTGQKAASGHPAARRLAAALAALMALLVLAVIALIAAFPGLVDSGFVGWLDLPLASRLALHLPLAVAVLAAALVGLGTIGWIRGWWDRSFIRQYSALFLAAVFLTAQVVGWNLVGWGWV
jgi:CubicO group peptidase (beta-lactamase class C family)